MNGRWKNGQLTMKKHTLQALQLVALSLAFTSAACEQNTAEPAAVLPSPDAISKPVSEIDHKAAGDEMDLTLQVAIAVTDVAERAGVAEDVVTVKEARVVSWGSSAVGCPRDDMNYMQVIVPGVLVLLEANGKSYRYHGEANREPFYCPDDRAEAPAYGQGEQFM